MKFITFVSKSDLDTLLASGSLRNSEMGYQPVEKGFNLNYVPIQCFSLEEDIRQVIAKIYMSSPRMPEVAIVFDSDLWDCYDIPDYLNAVYNSYKHSKDFKVDMIKYYDDMRRVGYCVPVIPVDKVVAYHVIYEQPLHDKKHDDKAFDEYIDFIVNDGLLSFLSTVCEEYSAIKFNEYSLMIPYIMSVWDYKNIPIVSENYLDTLDAICNDYIIDVNHY